MNHNCFILKLKLNKIDNYGYNSSNEREKVGEEF